LESWYLFKQFCIYFIVRLASSEERLSLCYKCVHEYLVIDMVARILWSKICWNELSDWGFWFLTSMFLYIIFWMKILDEKWYPHLIMRAVSLDGFSLHYMLAKYYPILIKSAHYHCFWSHIYLNPKDYLE